jgi:hypothetical protein
MVGTIFLTLNFLCGILVVNAVLRHGITSHPYLLHWGVTCGSGLIGFIIKILYVG